MIIPTKEECIRILKENNVPANIIAHSQKVCEVAMKVCGALEKRGINANRGLTEAASLLHDIAKVKEGDHVFNGSEIVKALGFPEVARVISKHGLAHLDEEECQPKSVEEKIVFYADMRVKHDRIVPVEKRFEYIRERYKSPNVDREYEFTKEIEKGLLDDKDI